MPRKKSNPSDERPQENNDSDREKEQPIPSEEDGQDSYSDYANEIEEIWNSSSRTRRRRTSIACCCRTTRACRTRSRI